MLIERILDSPARRTRSQARTVETEIGWDRDSNGRQFKLRKQRQIARVGREHLRATTGWKADRDRIDGFTASRRMRGALGPSRGVHDRACQLFRSAQNDDLLQGRSIEAIASVSVYVVYRLHEQPPAS